LKLDPRLNVTETDLQKLFELELKVRDDIEALHTAVNQMRGVRAQMEVVKERVSEQGDKGKPVLRAIQDLDQKMAPVEQELIQVKM